MERTDLSGEQLAWHAERTSVAGSLRLGPGERAAFELSVPLPARSFGLWWQGELGQASVTLLADRAVLVSWPLHEDHDQSPLHFEPAALGARPAGAARVAGLVHSYAGPYDAVRLELTGPVDLTSLSLVWIGVFEDPTMPAQPLAEGAGATTLKSAKALYPKPPVYARSSWSADPPQCSSSYCTTTHIAVHHTASSADYAASTWSQAAGNVKAIQAYHMYTNGWCDIGYHYLVSKEGWIFEGRGGGDDVKGAHDGFNCGSMGVAALGYFHSPVNNPTTAALLDGYEELGAWKCDQQGIDPNGSSYYAGYGATMNNVYGHRNVKATACPGDLLYAKLGEIRSGIAARLAGTPSSGKLKGVLYDASLGTTARLVGTVALAGGSFVETASDGYYEFALPAGTYSFAGTSPGHAIGSDSETVTSGDVWQSLGLWPSVTVPTHTTTDVGFNLFNATFQGDVGSPVWLGYAGSVGLPLTPLAAAGTLWIDLGAAQTLYLGTVPGSGVLSLNLSASGAPAGLVLHTQGYLIWQGQARLTNGAAWVAP